ncbi:MAG: ABC transporter permease [Fibrobacter sp.]|nr:ABC transporter permease [Fibrobacter sp.]
MRLLCTIIKQEWLLLIREPRFWIPFLLPPLLLLLLQFLLFSKQNIGAGHPLFLAQWMLLLGVLVAPMSASIAADSFAGEQERNSLELLLLSPIPSKTLFLAKFLATIPFPVIFILLIQAFYFHYHSIAVIYFIKALVGAISASFIVNAFALWVSLKSKTVRTANQSSLLVLFPILALVQWKGAFYLESAQAFFVVFVFTILILSFFFLLSLREFKKL